VKLAALAVLLLARAPAPPGSPLSEAPFPPHRIADDLYFVGSEGLASYLVTTPKGHILINPSFETTVPVIRASVEKLGFKFTDVKILLNSHAHDDLAGGMAVAQRLTGAQVLVMRGDDKTIASGADNRWKPTAVTRVLKDGDKVTLGGTTLTARLTPGHTPGCTTWLMRVQDAGKPFDAVVVCSPNVNAGVRLVDNKDYPEIASDYEKSFRLWKALPCDIFLGAHGNYYGLTEKHPRLTAKAKAGNPFVDRAGYQAYIEEREQVFRKLLAEQKLAKASGVQAGK
jgi:metallo-beta-lactamase class B